MGSLTQHRSTLRLLTFLALSWTATAIIPSPPQIIAQPLSNSLFFFEPSVTADETGKPFILECEAKGEPQPTYNWMKNGQPFQWLANDSRMSQQPGRGTLVVTKPSDEDEGYYQCVATNEHGTAVSNGLFVRKSELNPFPDEPGLTRVVNEWDPLTLVCSPPTSFPKPTIFWVIQSQYGALRSINSSRITVDPEGRLHFSSVTRDDGYDDAYYACSASIFFINEYKLGNRVKLDVMSAGTSSVQTRHPPVEQFTSPPNILVMRTHSLEIHCIFGGTPLPNIRWKKRGSELPRYRYKTINYGKTLRLKNVDFDDEGVYECTVSNGVGYAQARAMNVTVQSAPYWISYPKDTNAAVGESVEFECRAAGVPAPEIKWFMNGVPLTEAKRNPRRKLLDDSILKIEMLEKSDTAVYQCNASNAHGYVFKNFFINVLAIPPEITEPPAETYEIVHGLSITLTCRVFGAPKPIVTWHHEGRKLMGGRYITLDNGDLEIRNAYFMDAGHYSCKAENKLGAVESNESVGNLKANVPTPPQIIAQPFTDILLIQTPVEADEEEKPLILDCEAKGEPQPTYKWTHNGEQITFNERISRQPGRGTLVIREPSIEDIGSYQCTATNEHGIALSSGVFVGKPMLNSFPDLPPITMVVNEGDPLTLKCRPPAGFPQPVVSWVIQSQSGVLRSINSSRITVDPEGHLHFSSVRRDDGYDDAYYVCSASVVFLNDHELGNKVKLDVISAGTSSFQTSHPPIKQFISPPNIIAMRTHSLEIHCIFGGIPLPIIRWKKRDSELPRDRYTTINYGKTLRLQNVDFDDEGVYECTVSNGVGYDQARAMNVTVQSAPYWISEPTDTNAAEEESVEFKCKAAGVPEPEIKWFVNGVPLTEAKPNPRRKLIDSSTLKIEMLKKTDTTVYQCQATNTHGSLLKNFYINVLALPPVIIEPPAESYEIVDGLTITLTCRVFSAPKPIVTWRRYERELMGGRFKTLDNGDLEIRNCVFKDAGHYNCKAENKLGVVESDESLGNLKVRARTRITAMPEDYEIGAGQSATFRCNAVSDVNLDLTIDWLHNDKLIDFDQEPRIVKTADYSLAITRTQELDSGTYTCVASTRLDNTIASATLIVQDVPNPPRIVGVDCIRRTAIIRWQPMGDNRSPILVFKIQYNTSFSPDNWEDAFTFIPATYFRFQVPMSPWANYSFRVIAKNKIGESKPSEYSTTCQTPPDVPYKNPDNVVGKGTTPHNLVISWTPMPPLEHNAPGFFYRIYYRLDKSGAPWQIVDIVDYKTRHFEVSNQETFQQYRIKMAAFNSMGSAMVAAAEVIGFSGENVPLLAPSNLSLLHIIDGSTVELGWEPVSLRTVRGHFKGYKIQTWTARENMTQMRVTTVSASLTRTIIEYLVPNSQYNARILVFNGARDGPASEVISFQTPDGKPVPVASFEAVALGAHALYLTWKKPIEENGILTGYRIYYQQVKGTQLGQLMERDPPIADHRESRAKLSDLRRDTKYRISIRATTSQGEGDDYFIEASTSRNPPSPPDKPTFSWSVLPLEDGAAGVRVIWLPNISGPEGNPGSNFYVQFRKKGETHWDRTDEVIYEASTSIKGLEPGTVYEMNVVSVDHLYMTASDTEEIETVGVA